MISVNVKFIDGNVDSLTVSGHALYANPGKDIVCAGISSITQTAVLGVKELTNLKHSFKIDEKIQKTGFDSLK